MSDQTTVVSFSWFMVMVCSTKQQKQTSTLIK